MAHDDIHDVHSGSSTVRWSVSGLKTAVTSGALTATEVLDIALRRIAESQPVHNAFITVDADRARRQAEKLDQRLGAGEDIGPLAGVPIAVKDVFDVAGLPTTAGSSLFAENIATADGPEVAILRRSGALIIGKTNMDEFAFGPNQGSFGRTNCPADPERYAGGSSAGSAAAVAAGCVPVALGSDAGGSVRYPAACCGVVGYKPSFEHFAFQGTIPSLWSLDHLGVLGSDVDDVVRVTAAIAGERPTLPAAPGSPRFGVPLGWSQRCAEDIATAVSRALALLESCGAVLVDVAPVDETAVMEALLTTVSAEAAASLDARLTADQILRVAPPTQRLLDQGRTERATEYVRAQRYRALLRAKIDDDLSALDALLTPAIATTAKRWDAPDLNDWSIAKFLPTFNLTGHPAISVPVPGNRLPVGLQVVGHRHRDTALLACARWIEQRIEPRGTPQPLDSA